MSQGVSPPTAVAGRLTGGSVPGDQLSALLGRLAEQSRPALPRAVQALAVPTATGRFGRFALAVGGGLVLTALLLAVFTGFGVLV